MLKENQASDLKEVIFFVNPACSFDFYFSLNRICMNHFNSFSLHRYSTGTSVLTFQWNLIYAFWFPSVEWTTLTNSAFELQRGWDQYLLSTWHAARNWQMFSCTVCHLILAITLQGINPILQMRRQAQEVTWLGLGHRANIPLEPNQNECLPVKREKYTASMQVTTPFPPPFIPLWDTSWK